VFRDPLNPPKPTAMRAPTFALPRTPVHRARCVANPTRSADATARLAAAIRAATVDRA